MRFASPSESLRLFAAKLAARSALGEEEEQAILDLPAMPQQVSGHREIVHLGEQVDVACLVAQGTVARFAQLEDGRRQLISLHIAGDIADLYSLHLPASPSAIMALSPATIFQVPHAAIREAADRHPRLAAALSRDCMVDANIVAQWLVNVGRRDARGRMAHLLCEMALRYEAIGMISHGHVPLKLTQEHIADALGLTSVHVNRSLKTLREDGLVQLGRSELVVLDWEALVAAAEFDPAYLHLPVQRPAAMRAAW